MCTRQYLETCICIPADTQGLERIKVCEITADNDTDPIINTSLIQYYYQTCDVLVM